MIGNLEIMDQQGAPKYAVIRDWLAEKIGTGEISTGSRLPSESSLVRRFGVSRVTVRHALDALKRQGVVESVQGRGYFVRALKAELDLRRLEGLSEVLGSHGVKTEARLVHRRKAAAKGDIRKLFDLAVGTEVSELRRIRYVRGAPVCLEDRIMLTEIAERFSDADFETGDICALFDRDNEVSISFGDISMEILEAPDFVAAALNIEAKHLVVRTEQVSFAKDGAPIEFCIRYALADAFRYKSRVGRW